MSKKAYNAYYKKDEKGVYIASNSSLTDAKHSSAGVVQLETFKKTQYFEVTILKSGQTNPVVSVGFAPPPPEWKKLGHCGWYDGSVGYHGDTGSLYDDIGSSTMILEKYGMGDVIGAYWNTASNEVFFTKNGKKLDQWIAFRSTQVCGLMLPTITFDINDGVEFTVNYGETTYSYDLSKENVIEDVKDLKEIVTNDTKEIAIDLSAFINRKEGSDVTIKTSDGKVMYAHKLIVSARSKALCDSFSKNSEVTVSFDSETVMRILEYIYSGKTIVTMKNYEAVLKAADKFQLAALRKVCFEFIVKTLTKHTVLDVMLKSQAGGFEFDATDLLERCVVFVEKKASDIIKTDSFLRLSESVVIMMLKNTNTSADEYDLFKACIRWAENKQKEGDTREVGEILANIGKWIRYPQLGPIELVKKVKPTNVCSYEMYKEALEHIARPEATAPKTLEKLEFQSRYKLFTGSNLLDNKTAIILKRWLPYSAKGWECIYRATKDGFQANTFHSKCDNQGETCTIIESTLGNVFGGYNPTHWSTVGSYNYDNRAFLFSLVNKKGKPVKFDNHGQDKNSTYNCSGYGPTFGGGHDLYICDNSNTVTSNYCNGSYSFKIPGCTYGSTEAQAFLAGAYNFQTKEIEVFRKIK